MATLYELFDQIAPTSSVGQPEFQVLIQWDQVDSVYVVYSMRSCSWCFASTKEQVIEMITPAWAASSGWLSVGKRVSLPSPGEIARCEECGWLFWLIMGYYEAGQYAYCSDCCQW